MRQALPVFERDAFTAREKALTLRTLGQVQLATGQELGLSNVESAVVLFQSIRQTQFCDLSLLSLLPSSGSIELIPGGTITVLSPTFSASVPTATQLPVNLVSVVDPAFQTAKPTMHFLSVTGMVYVG